LIYRWCSSCLIAATIILRVFYCICIFCIVYSFFCMIIYTQGMYLSPHFDDNHIMHIILYIQCFCVIIYIQSVHLSPHFGSTHITCIILYLYILYCAFSIWYYHLYTGYAALASFRGQSLRVSRCMCIYYIVYYTILYIHFFVLSFIYRVCTFRLISTTLKLCVLYYICIFCIVYSIFYIIIYIQGMRLSPHFDDTHTMCIILNLYILHFIFNILYIIRTLNTGYAPLAALDDIHIMVYNTVFVYSMFYIQFFLYLSYIQCTHLSPHFDDSHMMCIILYGVATISRLLKMKGLFCKRAL